MIFGDFWEKNSKFSCLASLGIVTTKRSHISGCGKNIVKYLYDQNLQINRNRNKRMTKID